MNNIPLMVPDEEHLPYKLTSTPKEQPSLLEQMWREAAGDDMPPALSEAQIELLRRLAASFGEEPQEGLDQFGGMVIQQMEHLMARVEAQDKLLIKLQEQIQRHEQVHKQAAHPTKEPEQHSVEGVWGSAQR